MWTCSTYPRHLIEHARCVRPVDDDESDERPIDLRRRNAACGDHLQPTLWQTWASSTSGGTSDRPGSDLSLRWTGSPRASARPSRTNIGEGGRAEVLGPPENTVIGNVHNFAWQRWWWQTGAEGLFCLNFLPFRHCHAVRWQCGVTWWWQWSSGTELEWNMVEKSFAFQINLKFKILETWIKNAEIQKF